MAAEKIQGVRGGRGAVSGLGVPAPTLPCLSLGLEVRGLQACQDLQGGVVDQLEASEQRGE